MKASVGIESWYKTWCPYCGSANFHCNGNEQDLSALDVDAVKCYQCSKEYKLCPDDLDDFSDIMNVADGISQVRR
jgi:hypothetical protein